MLTEVRRGRGRRTRQVEVAHFLCNASLAQRANSRRTWGKALIAGKPQASTVASISDQRLTNETVLLNSFEF